MVISVKNIAQEYTTKVEMSLSYVDLAELTSVEHFTDGKDKVVVSFTDKTILKGALEKETVVNRQLVVPRANFEKIKESMSKYSSESRLGGRPLIGKEDYTIYLVSEAFLEYYRFHGKEGQFSDLDKDTRQVEDFFEKDILGQCAREDALFVQFRRTESDIDYVVTDQGRKLIKPFYLSYIDGNLDNGNYKLDEFAEHLLNNFDVVFYKDSRNEKVWSQNKPSDEELSGIIKSIPYYNAEEGRTECLELLYFPSKEETEKILSAQPKSGGWFWSREYVVNEILGGKDFKVNPKPDAHQPQKRKFR